VSVPAWSSPPAIRRRSLFKSDTILAFVRWRRKIPPLDPAVERSERAQPTRLDR
jgi:hypothetical protein